MSKNKFKNPYINFSRAAGIKHKDFAKAIGVSSELLTWYKNKPFDRVKEENARHFLSKIATQINQFLAVTPREAFNNRKSL